MSEVNSAGTCLRIRLFGSFSASIDDRPLPALRTRKGQWLLSLLALRAGRPAERSWVAGMLWPDSHEEQSLCNLRRALTDLRSALGPAADRLTAPSSRSLALELRPADEVDVALFRRLVETGETSCLEVAVELYSGPLLEGCDEHWVHQERAGAEIAYLDALDLLGRLYLEEHRIEDALRCFKIAASVDPLRESAIRGQMQAHSEAGNLAAATQLYRDFRVMLSDELNSTPNAETAALFQLLQKRAEAEPQSGAALPEQVSPGRSLSGKVPRPLTALVGRDAEAAEIRALLNEGRLVTLVGAGGIGKTRLAIRASEAVSDMFEDGAWFNDLSGIKSPELVSSFLASTFEASQSAAQGSMASLAAFLGNKRLLLILDNCEHLISACAALAQDLLAACPNMRVLATSREPLNVIGERRFVVPALSCPRSSTGKTGVEEIAACDSVRLFVERGKAHCPGFELTPQSAPCVAEICRQLDGMPLGIELAAARLNVLSPEQIAARLKDRFKLLTGGSRTAAPRHQTLQALIDWSHDLLSPAEQTLLRRLGVFAGGWSISALEAVCSDGIGAGKLLDLFTSLIEKSLVQADVEVEGERRYRLLETIREFALTRLRASGEFNSISRQHAAYFLEMAEKGNDLLVTVARDEWLHRMDLDLDNFNEALAWMASEPGASGSQLRMVNGLGRFWFHKNLYAFGRRSFEAAILAADGTDPEALTRAYNGAGSMCWVIGDYDAAQAHYEKHLELRRMQNQPAGLGSALQNLGLVAMHRGEYPLARSLMEESIDMLRTQESRALLATALNNLAIVAKDMHDLTYAHDLAMESFAIHEEMQNRSGMASVLICLGNLKRRIGRRDEARESLLAALSHYREIPERHGAAIALHNLAEMEQQDGDFAAAQRHYAECMEISRDINDQRQLATSLGNLAQLHRDEGRLEEYRRLLRESAGIAVSIQDRMLMMNLLTDLAELAESRGDLSAVPRILGAISAAAERFGSPLRDDQELIINRVSAAAAAHLDASFYSSEYDGGRESALDKALLAALEKA